MIINSLSILYIVYFSSILLHVVAVIFSSFFVLPLQIREAQISDELIDLRRELLSLGITMILLGIISILALTSRFIFSNLDVTRYVAVFLVLAHSLGFAYLARCGYRMYHLNIQLRDEVTDLDKKDVK